MDAQTNNTPTPRAPEPTVVQMIEFLGRAVQQGHPIPALEALLIDFAEELRFLKPGTTTTPTRGTR